jgi:hypothetical protein
MARPARWWLAAEGNSTSGAVDAPDQVSGWRRGTGPRRGQGNDGDEVASESGRRLGRIGVGDMAPSIWRRRWRRRRGHGGDEDGAAGTWRRG